LPRHAFRLKFLVGAVLCLCVVGALVSRGGESVQDEARDEQRSAELSRDPEAAPTTLLERKREDVRAKMALEARGDAGRPLPDGKVRPHPDSPERDALLEGRAWMERAKAAARSGDVAQLRQILSEKPASVSPSDFADWIFAYEIICACLEDGDAASRERARRFIEEERGSTMRRDVRRYCGF
jgi:hypothetical protein